MPFEPNCGPFVLLLFQGMVGLKSGFCANPIITGIKGQQPELVDTNKW
jgi:hypothetical protein